ncbi:AEC family transporter [Alteribacillus sp. YIM 98480]|uniref:AEC family transporter n=1 Tax=Alteribacillus sp. YIM 98480 TaxID=2606599 RepID=UPI00351BB454
MELLFQILLQIIFPVFLLLFIGAFLHRIFQFDLSTLSKMLTYIFLPAVIFSNIYQNEMEGGLLLQVGGFLAVQLVILAVIAHIIARLLKMDRKLTSTFKNSLVLNNSGNFGLPVSQLVFQSNPIGASIQIIVMMFQNILTYTYGLMNAASAKQTDLSALKELFKTPIPI